MFATTVCVLQVLLCYYGPPKKPSGRVKFWTNRNEYDWLFQGFIGTRGNGQFKLENWPKKGRKVYKG